VLLGKNHIKTWPRGGFYISTCLTAVGHRQLDWQLHKRKAGHDNTQSRDVRAKDACPVDDIYTRQTSPSF